MKKKNSTLSLPEIVQKSNGDFREPTLRKLGLSGDDVRLVVRTLDAHGITHCPGKRQCRRLAVPSIADATQLALNIPFDEIYEQWRGTHSRRKVHNVPSTENVRITEDQFYHGAVFPAREVLTPPERIFTKTELQRGEGYGEFDTGAKATVIESGDVYVYNGYRWVRQEAG
jgi:hypothetical protein